MPRKAWMCFPSVLSEPHRKTSTKALATLSLAQIWIIIRQFHKFQRIGGVPATLRHQKALWRCALGLPFQAKLNSMRKIHVKFGTASPASTEIKLKPLLLMRTVNGTVQEHCALGHLPRETLFL